MVPGIGTTCSPCASTQASATCAGVAPQALGDGPHGVDEGGVRRHGLVGEARVAGAEVVGAEAAGRDRAGEEAAAERRERQEARRRGPRTRAAPRRAASRVHSDSSDCTVVTGWTACARSSSATPTSHIPRKRTLPACTASAIAPQVSSTGTSLVDAVQLPQVDVVDAEALQRGVDAGAHVLGPAVAGHRAVALHQADLGGEDRLVAAAGEGAADQLLVGERPVDVGGVDERHAEVERAADDLDRDVVVALLGAVGPGHAHAAEADGADGGARRAQGALLHSGLQVDRQEAGGVDRPAERRPAVAGAGHADDGQPAEAPRRTASAAGCGRRCGPTGGARSRPAAA